MSDASYVAVPTSTSRSVIAVELRRRHEEAAAQQQEENARREAQRDRTRSLVRLMQLDTRDGIKVALHAENASHYNLHVAVQEQISTLQSRYQLEKKRLATVHDKKERHERLQHVKVVRERNVAILKQHLAQLDVTAPAVVRPGSSFSTEISRAATPAEIVSLPEVEVSKGKKLRHGAVSAKDFKELMDRIRAIKQERRTMLDPYTANLKLARLWDRLHDTTRCLENYEAACRMLKDTELAQIPPEVLDDVLEKQRLRRRTSLHYLFSRALQRKQRREASDLISKFISLALPEDRAKDLYYVERILREQEYIEDPTLASPDAIMFAIRSTNSLGHLTDLRFQLLQELLAESPRDPYLIESVANIHVRKGEFATAEALTARFMALPSIKQISLFNTLSKLRCGI